MDTLSPEFQVRHLTLDDIAALTQLLITYDIAMFGASDLTEERVRANWQSSHAHLETDSWGVFTPDGKLVAAAEVDNQAYIVFFPFACVHPDYTGRGIGTYLLHLMEQWIVDHMHLAPENTRIISGAGVSNKNSAAQQLFEHEGYSIIRRFWNMEIEIHEPPSPPQWAEGITVRTFVRGQDDRAVFEMIEGAFQDHWGHIPQNFGFWEHDRLNRPGFDPTLWFLASEGERIVGSALCSYTRKPERGRVNQLGVLRSWRHKGVGMALLLHAFNEFYRRGTRLVELNVDSQNLTGAVRLYERAGMHVARENIAYEKEMRAGVEMSTQSIGE